MRRFQRFKNIILKGIVVVLPTLLTLFVIYKLLLFVNDEVGMPITSVVKSVLMTEIGTGLLSKLGVEEGIIKDKEKLKALLDAKIHVIFGNIVAIILLIIISYVLGFIVRNFIGKKLFKYFEKLMSAIPVIKMLYSAAKQFVSFFFEPKQAMEEEEEKASVLVEYPRKDSYILGFLTGDSFAVISKKTGKKMVNVFVPTVPAPFTGFVVIVPEEDVIRLPISVDEAVKFLVAAGVVTPDIEKIQDVTKALPG